MVKFLLRLMKHLLILFCISIPLQVLGIVVLLFVLPIVRYRAKTLKGSIKLPAALKWFDNADIWIGRDVTAYLKVVAQGFWYHYYWLTLRNPCNYFSYRVLGFVPTHSILTKAWTNRFSDGHLHDPKDKIGDNGGKYGGFHYSEYEIDGKLYYEYYYIKVWNPTHCLRFRMGYKLDIPQFSEAIAQVCVFLPYKSFTGIS